MTYLIKHAYMLTWSFSLHRTPIDLQYQEKLRPGRGEWDASSLQGYPPALNSQAQYQFLHLGGGRDCESKVSCLRRQRSVPRQGSNPDRSLRSRAH